MALTRARVIYGAEEDRAAVDAVITRTLAKSRDQAQLRADVVKMRGEMAAHKKPSGGLDVKLLPGGLVDLEFVEIGRAHVLTPVTNAHLVCRLLLEKKQQ